MKIISADVGDDGVARLVARDDRLDLETYIYVATDGNSWVFERNRHTAGEIRRGNTSSWSSPPAGKRIRHSEWELIPDAAAAAAG